MRNFSVVILSAGRSSRMGRPKALLPFSENESFLTHICSIYLKAGAKRIITVCSPEMRDMMQQEFQISNLSDSMTIATNETPNGSRFSSIQTGLQYVDSDEYVFIQNIDNPFIDTTLINKLMNIAEAGKYCAPSFEGRKGHPVLISSEIRSSVLSADAVRDNFRELLSKSECKTVEADNEMIRANINTPSEYLSWFGATA